MGGASVLSLKGLARPGSGFQALATVVAATTLVMAGASVAKLLPPRRRIAQALTTVQPPRRQLRGERLRDGDGAWIAVS
ncbi:hypothetical protein [Kitasatospora sp. LaBMicrA B282]|uniref:hypothetical protein n=1 Tax=Kitasatospora sp. LaBMicrA B282 TaxID=3420949 RepID=UPI003D12CD68